MDFFNSNYDSRFLISIPKKQAKSYEIDLGQNEGAYSEQLLIRYGDNTLNHMKANNRKSATKMEMDDIARMNEQLRPFQERPKDEEGAVSYNTLCDNIEVKIGKMDDSANYLSEFEGNLNKAIEVMTNDIFKFFDDTYNEFNPKLLEKYSYLKSKIKEQKDENANLLKQIDFLLQENTQIMDMVYKIGSRLEKLEKKAGIDKPDMSYDKNYEEQKSNEESEESASASASGSKSQSQQKSKENENENNEEEQKEVKEGEGENEGEENGGENDEGKINEENEVIQEDEKNQSNFSGKEQEESKDKSKENNEEN